jgi:hypothetical protein
MESIADSAGGVGYILPMSSSDPLELNDAARAEYHARWEAVEAFKAQELAAMTEERAREIIQRLGAIEGWRERPDWSGLVEQQALFHQRRSS